MFEIFSSKNQGLLLGNPANDHRFLADGIGIGRWLKSAYRSSTIENTQRLNADKKSDDTKKISADDLEFGAIRNPEYEILVIKSISSDNQVRRICLGNKH